MHLIYFLTKLHFTLWNAFLDLWKISKLTYLAVWKNRLHLVFVTLISNYGKLTAYELNELKVSLEIMWCQGYCFEYKFVYVPRVGNGKTIVKHRLSSAEVVSPNQHCWHRNNCSRVLNEVKGLLSKSFLVTRQRRGEERNYAVSYSFIHKDNRWEYFVIKCRFVRFSCLAKF